MFSIVMPLWNKQSLVAATVASVLAQTRGDFELIVVDDGSTDDSPARVAAFDDPRIRILTQRRAGVGPARNAGIAAARHDWIALLDADDIWLPDHLAELDRVRERCPQAGLIGTAFTRSDPAGRYRLPVRAEGGIELINYFERVAEGDWSIFCTSSAAIPRSTFETLGGFGRAKAGQDAEYWAAIALERPIAISRRVTAVYRPGTGGISDTQERVAFGGEVREARDICPSVALLVDRGGAIRTAQMRDAVDRYIDCRIQGCVRRSARRGDMHRLRSLRQVYLRPPRMTDRLILAIARLPRPLARAAYGFGLAIKAQFRLLKRGSRALGWAWGADPDLAWRVPPPPRAEARRRRDSDAHDARVLAP